MSRTATRLRLTSVGLAVAAAAVWVLAGAPAAVDAPYVDETVHRVVVTAPRVGAEEVHRVEITATRLGAAPTLTAETAAAVAPVRAAM